MIYKRWSYKLFIYTVILNVVVMFLVINSTIFNDYSLQIFICSIIALVTLILGIVFGIISYQKKEDDDFKKKLGLYGNLAILGISIMLQVFGNV